MPRVLAEVVTAELGLPLHPTTLLANSLLDRSSGTGLCLSHNRGGGAVRNPTTGPVFSLPFWALWDIPGEHWLPTQGQQGKRGRSLWINKS